MSLSAHYALIVAIALYFLLLSRTMQLLFVKLASVQQLQSLDRDLHPPRRSTHPPHTPPAIIAALNSTMVLVTTLHSTIMGLVEGLFVTRLIIFMLRYLIMQLFRVQVLYFIPWRVQALSIHLPRVTSQD
jgi:hypothetical protein